MFFFCIPVRRNWILCQHGIPCVGVRACCSLFVSLIHSSSLCPCMHVPECVVFVSVPTYVSHFSFIALWHLFMIARPQHNSQTAKGVLKNMYSRHNYRVVVFSVTFAMVTRKYIYRLQLHVHTYVHTYVCICVCVCVTFVESLWLLLAPLAYFNNIYVYLTSLCALPSAVLCFPYKLSRTTLKEEVASGSWSCKSLWNIGNLFLLNRIQFTRVELHFVQCMLVWYAKVASAGSTGTEAVLQLNWITPLLPLLLKLINEKSHTAAHTHTHTNTYLEQHACVSQPVVVVVARTLGVIMCINHRNTHTHTETNKLAVCYFILFSPPITAFRMLQSLSLPLLHFAQLFRRTVKHNQNLRNAIKKEKRESPWHSQL